MRCLVELLIYHFESLKRLRSLTKYKTELNCLCFRQVFMGNNTLHIKENQKKEFDFRYTFLHLLFDAHFFLTFSLLTLYSFSYLYNHDSSQVIILDKNPPSFSNDFLQLATHSTPTDF